MSLEDFRRKGSWAVRHYSNPRGSFIKADGSPTPLAKQAIQWGEKPPRTREEAQAIAAKGRKYLETYRKYKAKGYTTRQKVYGK